jgi:hypothetical protein
VPLDLSRVLFVCTSNTLDTIHPALLDRCEVVRLAGYTHAEKLAIARRFILPKQLAANGLDGARFEADDACVGRIVDGWTREAGVRSLERAVGAVVRAKAVQWAEAQDARARRAEGKAYERKVEEWELEGILGPGYGDPEEREREERPGLVYGLVVTGMGEGGILPVETSTVPGSGRLKLTGSLGDVRSLYRLTLRKLGCSRLCDDRSSKSLRRSRSPGSSRTRTTCASPTRAARTRSSPARASTRSTCTCTCPPARSARTGRARASRWRARSCRS